MAEKMDSEREAFEKWYVENAFDYEANPLGSRDCGLQWKAWQAAHLTHPAQAVDVEKVREVIDGMRCVARLSDYDLLVDTLNGAADKLTAALPKGSNGAEGVGHG